MNLGVDTHLGRHVRKIVLIFFLINIIGIAGYMLIEGWPFLDAFYMAVMTISTVGFNEVKPLSDAGIFFTTIYIILGVGAFLYTMAVVAEYTVAGHLKGDLERRKMRRKTDALNDHFILCGFGKVGLQVANELLRENCTFVVIDKSPESVKRCMLYDFIYIEGNAAEDEVLKEAGIMRARGLVTATDSDSDNVYVTLSAKSLRADLVVVARATTEEAETKLIKAGADRVISPYTLGGKRLASLLIRPTVVEFMDVLMGAGGSDIELLMEDVTISARSRFVGKTIVEARSKCIRGCNILALKKKDVGTMMPHPSAETVIEQGDCLVVMGTREQLRDVELLN